MRMRLVIAAFGALLFGQTATAQYYNPQSGASPLVQLQSPPDGIAYFGLRQRALAAYEQENWLAAEPLLDELARLYPRDPETWRMLARVKRRLNKFDAAGAAVSRAAPVLGEQTDYLLALNSFQGGDRRQSLELLRRAIFDRGGLIRQKLIDYFPDFEPLKDDPEFRELIGLPDTRGWSRQRGWAYDIDYLYSEAKRVNPDYREKPFPQEVVRRYQQLKASVSNLSDEELYFGLRQMLAPLRQGHIFVYDRNGLFLPVQLYAFPEGIFITGADAANQQLIGSRVERVGSMSAEEALRKISEARSVDGDMEYLSGTWLLGEAAALKAIGATKSTTSVELTLQSRGGPVQKVSLATAPLAGKPRLQAAPGADAPLFLSKPDEAHWEQALPEHDAHYVQVNNMAGDPDEPLTAFGERLWSVLDQSKPKNLIIDMRHNDGGSTQEYPQLLRSVIAFSRIPGNQVYALIGRTTYSAAANFITDLERLANPIFVGEPSSECCNLYGDANEVTLPYSGIQADLTAMKWNLSTPSDHRREMAPQVPVQLTAKAYFSNEDPALSAVLRLLRQRPQPK